MPHEPPLHPHKDEDDEGREIDALLALATRMREQPLERLAPLLLMLGDQVYADEDSPENARVHPLAARPSEPPDDEVLDFEEYTRLYWESWGDPADPLAALDGRDGDDLRRPRRPRRLEHLGDVGARRCAPSRWWDERISAR